MTRTEAEQLIQELFDGTISEEDSCRLEEQLVLDPNLTRVYREHALLHYSLEARSERAIPLHPSIDPSPVVAAHLQRNRRKQLIGSILAAAALFVVLGVVLRLIFLPPPEPSFRFLSAADSSFSIVHPDDSARSTKPGIAPIGTTVNLTQGTMELHFEKDVRSVVTAPAKFTLEQPDRLHLATGKAWFHVPPGAEGFQVRTSGLLITDRGTEFGVITVPGSTDEVHVIRGRIDVRCLYGKQQNASLAAGDARRASPTGKLDPAPGLAAPFQTILPDRLRYMHFPFDGSERDPITARGNHPALKTLKIEAIQSDQRPVASRRRPGRFGNALYFDGLGDIVRTNWPGVYGSNPLTISCWVKPEGDPTYGGVVGWGVGKHDVAGPFQWKVLVAPNPVNNGPQRILRCAWGDRSQIGADVTLRENQWHHCAVVFTGESDSTTNPVLRFYFDGREIPPRNQKFPDPPRRPTDLLDAKPLMMGTGLSDSIEYEPFSKFFRGTMDEIFIIEGALTDTQIRELYERNTYSPDPANR